MQAGAIELFSPAALGQCQSNKININRQTSFAELYRHGPSITIPESGVKITLEHFK